MIEPNDETQNAQNEADADKIFLTDDSTLQSKEESEDAGQDDYYKVDEKKLVTTNIGDGTSHDDGLASTDDTENEDGDQ